MAMTEKALGAMVITSKFNMSSQGVLGQEDLTSSTNMEMKDQSRGMQKTTNGTSHTVSVPVFQHLQKWKVVQKPTTYMVKGWKKYFTVLTYSLYLSQEEALKLTG